MDGCLACLAQEYLNVKFCRIKASDARLSYRFVSADPPTFYEIKAGDLPLFAKKARKIFMLGKYSDIFSAGDTE